MKVFGKNSPIGFFDSGVGGLSVYSKFKKVLPNENTLYFGDLAHLPYGNKTQEELVSYARGILKFYEQKGVKAVVIACNTSSAQAYDIVKNIEYNITEDNLTNIVFSAKYKNLDKYHKKLLLIKVLYNKNKILNLYKKYEFKEEKEKIKYL